MPTRDFASIVHSTLPPLQPLIQIPRTIPYLNFRKRTRRIIFRSFFGGVGVLLLIGILAFAGLNLIESRNAANTANSNAAQGATVTLGAKAQKAEEKILRGETLTPDDISGITNDELRIVRNVSFARYGRKYERPGLGDYFYTKSWYKPNDNYSDSMVTAIDKVNIDLIIGMENGVSANKAAAKVMNSSSGTGTGNPANNYQDSGNPTNSLSQEALAEVKKFWDSTPSNAAIRIMENSLKHMMPVTQRNIRT